MFHVQRNRISTEFAPIDIASGIPKSVSKCFCFASEDVVLHAIHAYYFRGAHFLCFSKPQFKSPPGHRAFVHRISAHWPSSIVFAEVGINTDLDSLSRSFIHTALLSSPNTYRHRFPCLATAIYCALHTSLIALQLLLRAEFDANTVPILVRRCRSLSHRPFSPSRVSTPLQQSNLCTPNLFPDCSCDLFLFRFNISPSEPAAAISIPESVSIFVRFWVLSSSRLYIPGTRSRCLRISFQCCPFLSIRFLFLYLAIAHTALDTQSKLFLSPSQLLEAQPNFGFGISFSYSSNYSLWATTFQSLLLTLLKLSSSHTLLFGPMLSTASRWKTVVGSLHQPLQPLDRKGTITFESDLNVFALHGTAYWSTNFALATIAFSIPKSVLVFAFSAPETSLVARMLLSASLYNHAHPANDPPNRWITTIYNG